MDEMVKPSVLANPSLMNQYHKAKADLLSDGSVEGNTTYGKWAMREKWAVTKDCSFWTEHSLLGKCPFLRLSEREGLDEVIYLGCKFYALMFKDGCEMKKCRGMKSVVLQDMPIDQIRRLLHDPSLTLDGENSVFRHYRSIMSTAVEEKNVSCAYMKRIFGDQKFDQTISIDKYNRQMMMMCPV